VNNYELHFYQMISSLPVLYSAGSLHCAVCFHYCVGNVSLCNGSCFIGIIHSVW